MIPSKPVPGSVIAWITSKENRPYWLLFSLVGIALALRSYKVGDLKLWLDEIYAYQLGSYGLGVILRNSLSDPHPPLWYLLHWVSTGFGALHSEWGMRWLSVLSGSLTVGLLYLLARRRASDGYAALGGILLAISPFHIYFSQEARPPIFVALLAVSSTILLERLINQPSRRSSWLWFGLISLAGLYSSYSYILVTSIQIIWLLLLPPTRRVGLGMALALGMASLPLLYLFWRSIPSTSQAHAELNTGLIEIIKAMFGRDPLRYGFSWTHSAIIACLTGLSLPLLWKWRNKSLGYYVLQTLLPLLIFFGILVPVVEIGLPLSEAKQFIVILPAFYTLFSLGMQSWAQPPIGFFGSVAGISLAGVVLVASLVSLPVYWQLGKSPEGEAVQWLNQQVEPGQAIVSLHYSLDAALNYYTPETPVYTRPAEESNFYFFSDNTPAVRGAPLPASDIPARIVLEHATLWLLVDERNPGPVQAWFYDRCQALLKKSFTPFSIYQLTSCREKPSTSSKEG